jgi:hypothetical protein
MAVPVHVVARAPGRGPGRWPGLLVVAGVLLVPDDRLLAGIVMAAGWDRLVTPLVGASVAGLPGPVPCLTVGGALALAVPGPLVFPGIAAFAVPRFLRPVHLRHPFIAARQPCLGAPRAVAGNEC